MDTVNDLLDNAKKMCGLETDSDLARRLNVRPSAVSNWRNGRAAPDVITAATLASMTNEKLARVVALLEESRAVSKEAKAIWRKIATAAVICLAVYTSTGTVQAATFKFDNPTDVVGIAHLKRLVARILNALFRSSIDKLNGGFRHGEAALC